MISGFRYKSLTHNLGLTGFPVPGTILQKSPSGSTSVSSLPLCHCVPLTLFLFPPRSSSHPCLEQVIAEKRHTQDRAHHQDGVEEAVYLKWFVHSLSTEIAS